jgi:hypothetical protein
MKLNQCAGGGFRKPEGGTHYFIMVSDLSPRVCYYCNESEGK